VKYLSLEQGIKLVRNDGRLEWYPDKINSSEALKGGMKSASLDQNGFLMTSKKRIEAKPFISSK